MAKDKKEEITQDWIKDIWKKKVKLDKEEERKTYIKAGKELAMFMAYLNSLGKTFEVEAPIALANFVKDVPEVLEEVLKYYQALSEAPKIAGYLLNSFNARVINGELQLHIVWRDLSLEQVQKVVKNMLADKEGNQ